MSRSENSGARTWISIWLHPGERSPGSRTAVRGTKTSTPMSQLAEPEPTVVLEQAAGIVDLAAKDGFIKIHGVETLQIKEGLIVLTEGRQKASKTSRSAAISCPSGKWPAATTPKRWVSGETTTVTAISAHPVLPCTRLQNRQSANSRRWAPPSPASRRRRKCRAWSEALDVRRAIQMPHRPRC